MESVKRGLQREPAPRLQVADRMLGGSRSRRPLSVEGTIAMTAVEWTTRLFRRRAEVTAPASGTRKYLMRRQLALAQDDVPVEDEQGGLAFSVDGRALCHGHSLTVRDPHAQPLYRIPERSLHLKEVMEIEHGDGGMAATVRRTKIGTTRDRWTVTLYGRDDQREGLHLRGSVGDYEYRVMAVDRQVAEVSKRWFRLRNTYGVAIPPAEDDPFILTITAAVDLMAH
jgi:uncharacterized protein YxjI